jgi:hypothetical protein
MDGDSWPARCCAAAGAPTLCVCVVCRLWWLCGARASFASSGERAPASGAEAARGGSSPVAASSTAVSPSTASNKTSALAMRAAANWMCTTAGRRADAGRDCGRPESPAGVRPVVTCGRTGRLGSRHYDYYYMRRPASSGWLFRALRLPGVRNDGHQSEYLGRRRGGITGAWAAAPPRRSHPSPPPRQRHAPRGCARGGI